MKLFTRGRLVGKFDTISYVRARKKRVNPSPLFESISWTFRSGITYDISTKEQDSLSEYQETLRMKKKTLNYLKTNNNSF